MAIFHSYVKLPEAIGSCKNAHHARGRRPVRVISRVLQGGARPVMFVGVKKTPRINHRFITYTP